MFQHEERCEGSSVSSILKDLIQTLTLNNLKMFSVSEKSLAAQHVFFASLARFLVFCLP